MHSQPVHKNLSQKRLSELRTSGVSSAPLHSQRTQNERADQPDRGAVTAEFAVVLPAVVFVLAIFLGAVATGIVQLNLEEASRVGARAAARGDTAQNVQQLAHEIDEDIAISIEANSQTVVVRTSKQAPGIIGSFTGWTLHAESVIPAEVAGKQDVQGAN